MTHLPLSVVIPARNEAATIGAVVQQFLGMDWVDEVVVVDNASEDDTAKLAQEAGARSVFEAQPGMGHAVRAGLAAARHDWVMKVDADLEKFNVKLFSEMVASRHDGVGLIKGDWSDPKDNMPMTRLLVKPAMSQIFPGLSGLRSPNTGIYLVNRTLIAHQEIVGSYAADLDVMVRVYAAGAGVIEADIGRIQHDMRDVGHYNKMAETIMAFLLSCHDARLTEEIVVLAQSADVVLQNAMGLCAKRAKAGALVNLFLADFGSTNAAHLQRAMAEWPTVRILPIKDAKSFVPQGPERRVQLLCSETHVALAGDISTKLSAKGAVMSEPLVMLGGAAQRSDHGFDVASVMQLKSQTLSAAGLPPAETTREVFQSLQSYQSGERPS